MTTTRALADITILIHSRTFLLVVVSVVRVLMSSSSSFILKHESNIIINKHIKMCELDYKVNLTLTVTQKNKRSN